MPWIDIALALVGFGITAFLAFRAKKAAEAAKAAVEATTSEVSRSLLLGLAPGLRRIEEALERSVREGHEERSYQLLVEWRARANEVRGLLVSYGNTGRSPASQLQKSVTLASTIKSALSKDALLSDAYAEVLVSIAKANDAVSLYASQLTTSTPAESEATK